MTTRVLRPFITRAPEPTSLRIGSFPFSAACQAETLTSWWGANDSANDTGQVVRREGDAELHRLAVCVLRLGEDVRIDGKRWEMGREYTASVSQFNIM